MRWWFDPPLRERAREFWPWVRTLRHRKVTRWQITKAVFRFWFGQAKPLGKALEERGSRVIPRIEGFMWRRKR